MDNIKVAILGIGTVGTAVEFRLLFPWISARIEKEFWS